MVATLDVTPHPAEGALAINVTTDGLTLTDIRRQDANGSASVRTDAGTFPTTNPPIIVDYEPALVGPVVYRAFFADGPTLTYSRGDGWAPEHATWVSVPLWPVKSVAVTTVTQYDADRGSGNVFHDVIDRVDPVVTLAPLRTRRGTFEAWCTDYAAALQVAAVHDLAQVLMLRQDAHPGLDMFYAVDAGSVSITHYPLSEGMPTRWAVRVPYREVTRPAGDLIENAGWTCDAVAAEFDTFASLPGTFATFDDLATNTRATP